MHLQSSAMHLLRIKLFWFEPVEIRFSYFFRSENWGANWKSQISSDVSFAFASRFFEITDVYSKVCYQPIWVWVVVDERGATTDRKQCIERTTPLFQTFRISRDYSSDYYYSFALRIMTLFSFAKELQTFLTKFTEHKKRMQIQTRSKYLQGSSFLVCTHKNLLN